MAKKVGISFKENDLEIKLYEFLKKKSAIIGESNYIKQLLLEEMQKEERDYYKK